MTLHQLRIFKSVAKHLNITRAAAELHVSQPSVSQQLRLLEEEFKVKLYEKVGQGIRLTEAGVQVVRKIEPILFHLDELEQYLQATRKEKPDPTLTVGVSYAISETLLPRALQAFRKIHPQVRIHIHADRSSVIEEAVLNESVEVGLFYNPSNHASLDYHYWGADNVVFVASRSDPLIGTDTITPDQLRALPIVVQKPRAKGDMPNKILDYLREQGFSPNIVMQCDSINSVRAAVAGGAGMGFIIESTARKQPDELKLITVQGFETFAFEACVACHRNRVLSQPAQGFFELVRDLEMPELKRRVEPPLM